LLHCWAFIEWEMYALQSDAVAHVVNMVNMTCALGDVLHEWTYAGRNTVIIHDHTTVLHCIQYIPSPLGAACAPTTIYNISQSITITL
jgi:peroxiredoxin